MLKSVHGPHTTIYEHYVKRVPFDQLPLHLLVAGELKIITTKKISSRGRKTRLTILKVMCYHYEFLDIKEIRDQYSALLRKVQSKRVKWSVKLASVIDEALRFRTIALKWKAWHKVRGGKQRQGEIDTEQIIYCNEYNRNKCKETGDHEGRFNNNPCIKKHICNTCLKERKLQVRHVEKSDACPPKK